MKKLVLCIPILLMLTLTACSNESITPSQTDSSGEAHAETITMPDAGIWPVNEYTEGLPVPIGTVAWALLDTEHGNCSISILDIGESAYQDYMALLKQKGFAVIDDVSEEIKGQGYVSAGTLLSDNNRWLSISYIPNQLTIYISFEK